MRGSFLLDVPHRQVVFTIPKMLISREVFSMLLHERLINKIIAHLKLPFMAERPPPPQIVQQELLMAAEEREKYF